MNDGTLLSFVGNHDPYADESDEPGPVLSLLGARGFGQVFLFCTGSAYVERAKTVEAAAKSTAPETKFTFVSVDLESVVDYEEIYRKLLKILGELSPRLEGGRVSVLLDPGTPQMQTSWFLLAKSGALEAELLQGVPPRFANGAYKVRTVNLDSPILPKVTPAAAPPAPEPEPGAARYASITGKPIVAVSRPFLAVLVQAERFARYDDVSVLVRGETGSGKDLVAGLLHSLGPRRDKPFVRANCASIPAALAESELFGHVKGAFTGADRDRLGLFRSADGGTLFLDEIGDLPVELQPKLLRAVEQRVVTPVGSDREVGVDVRLVAATNRDLEELIGKGLFRRDLYERIRNATLDIPPLRERTEDIPALIRLNLQTWNTRYGEEKGLAPETFALLVEYPWPGNVRELENAVKSLCAVGQGRAIGPDLLPREIVAHFRKPGSPCGGEHPFPEEGLDLKAYLFQLERDYYRRALQRSGGNKEKAAALLGLNGAAFRKAYRERFGEE